MMTKGLEMVDPKMAVGVVFTMSATAASWIEQATMYGQLVLTVGGIAVALLTAWYTYERIIKLRRERDKLENK